MAVVQTRSVTGEFLAPMGFNGLEMAKPRALPGVFEHSIALREERLKGGMEFTLHAISDKESMKLEFRLVSGSRGMMPDVQRITVTDGYGGETVLDLSAKTERNADVAKRVLKGLVDFARTPEDDAAWLSDSMQRMFADKLTKKPDADFRDVIRAMQSMAGVEVVPAPRKPAVGATTFAIGPRP